MDMDDYYPDWLGRDVFAGVLPWERALTTTISSFLQQYSFHDSYWIGLFLESNSNGVMIVRWDTFWTEGRVPFPGSMVAEWPILILRLSRLQHVEVALREDGLAGVTSSPLTEQEVQSLSVEGDLHRTQIDDHSGGVVQLCHEPNIALLCFNRQRDILEIPLKG